MPRIPRVTLSWLTGLLCLVGPPKSLDAQAASDDGHNVRLRIETDRAVYRAGDSVAIRLAFTNTAATALRYVPRPVWSESRLVVTDSSGRAVAPVGPRHGYHQISTITSTLPGGVTRVRTFGGEWIDLRRWGYDLLKPGRYTIEGAPLLTIPGARADTTLRSNRVTITVTP